MMFSRRISRLGSLDLPSPLPPLKLCSLGFRKLKKPQAIMADIHADLNNLPALAVMNQNKLLLRRLTLKSLCLDCIWNHISYFHTTFPSKEIFNPMDKITPILRNDILKMTEEKSKSKLRPNVGFQEEELISLFHLINLLLGPHVLSIKPPVRDQCSADASENSLFYLWQHFWRNLFKEAPNLTRVTITDVFLDHYVLPADVIHDISKLHSLRILDAPSICLWDKDLKNLAQNLPHLTFLNVGLEEEIYSCFEYLAQLPNFTHFLFKLGGPCGRASMRIERRRDGSEYNESDVLRSCFRLLPKLKVVNLKFKPPGLGYFARSYLHLFCVHNVIEPIGDHYQLELEEIVLGGPINVSCKLPQLRRAHLYQPGQTVQQFFRFANLTTVGLYYVGLSELWQCLEGLGKQLENFTLWHCGEPVRVSRIFNSCPRLQELRIHQGSLLEESGSQVASENLKNLRSLILEHLQPFSAKNVAKALKEARRLARLDLDGVYFVPEDAAELTSLLCQQRILQNLVWVNFSAGRAHDMRESTSHMLQVVKAFCPNVRPFNPPRNIMDPSIADMPLDD